MFDIIFIDQPYKDKNFNQILVKIIDTNLLNKNGIIIVHRHKNEKDNFTENYKIIDEKKYGISK